MSRARYQPDAPARGGGVPRWRVGLVSPAGAARKWIALRAPHTHTRRVTRADTSPTRQRGETATPRWRVGLVSRILARRAGEGASNPSPARRAGVASTLRQPPQAPEDPLGGEQGEQQQPEAGPVPQGHLLHHRLPRRRRVAAQQLRQVVAGAQYLAAGVAGQLLQAGGVGL